VILDLATLPSMSLHDAVRVEIESLHAFFVQWFSGVAPRDDATLVQGFTRRFTDDFVLIPPAGTRLGARQLGDGLERGHGSNPEFRVAIRRVELRLETADLVIATYEEWQRNAKASTPPDNGRVATVVFLRQGDGLRWQHIHETWLPADVMAVGPFDF